MASEFIRRHPPAESRLARYGAGFPRFLKTIDTLSDMPIVAETARLEWAIAEALDTASLPARSLAEYDSTDLGLSPDILLQPSLRLIVSHWSILSVWMEHQRETSVDKKNHLDKAPRAGGAVAIGELRSAFSARPRELRLLAFAEARLRP
jgi:hypothetical protein